MKTINIPLNGELYDFIKKFGYYDFETGIIKLWYEPYYQFIANTKNRLTFLTIHQLPKHLPNINYPIIDTNLLHYVYTNSNDGDGECIYLFLNAFYKKEQLCLTALGNKIFIEGFYCG